MHPSSPSSIPVEETVQKSISQTMLSRGVLGSRRKTFLVSLSNCVCSFFPRIDVRVFPKGRKEKQKTFFSGIKSPLGEGRRWMPYYGWIPGTTSPFVHRNVKTWKLPRREHIRERNNGKPFISLRRRNTFGIHPPHTPTQRSAIASSWSHSSCPTRWQPMPAGVTPSPEQRKQAASLSCGGDSRTNDGATEDGSAEKLK